SGRSRSPTTTSSSSPCRRTSRCPDPPGEVAGGDRDGRRRGTGPTTLPDRRGAPDDQAHEDTPRLRTRGRRRPGARRLRIPVHGRGPGRVVGGRARDPRRVRPGGARREGDRRPVGPDPGRLPACGPGRLGTPRPAAAVTGRLRRADRGRPAGRRVLPVRRAVPPPDPRVPLPQPDDLPRG